MKKDELRRHLGTVTLGLDTQWSVMHRQDLDDSTRVAAAGQYQGMLFTITALGGDWLRDDRTFTYFVKEFGPITKTRALQMFAAAFDEEKEERAIAQAAAKGEW